MIAANDPNLRDPISFPGKEIRPWAVQELDDISEVPPPVIIEGMLYQGGKMVIAAPSKARKSFLVWELAFCVANGLKWWGRKTMQGDVLVINLELMPWEPKRRMMRIQEAHGHGGFKQIRVVNLRGCNFKYIDLLSLLDVLQGQRFSLVIIDPVYKLLAGLNENDGGDITTFLNLAEAFASKLGAALALTHHYAKGNSAGKEAIDRSSGAGVWARDPDCIVNLTENESLDCFTVDAIVRSFPPVDPFVIQWEHPIYRIAETIDPDALRQKRSGRPRRVTADKIAEFVSVYESFTFSELFDKARRLMDCSKSSFSLALKEALLKKILFKDTDGKYQKLAPSKTVQVVRTPDLL